MIVLLPTFSVLLVCWTVLSLQKATSFFDMTHSFCIAFFRILLMQYVEVCTNITLIRFNCETFCFGALEAHTLQGRGRTPPWEIPLHRSYGLRDALPQRHFDNRCSILAQLFQIRLHDASGLGPGCICTPIPSCGVTLRWDELAIITQTMVYLCSWLHGSTHFPWTILQCIFIVRIL